MSLNPIPFPDFFKAFRVPVLHQNNGDAEQSASQDILDATHTKRQFIFELMASNTSCFANELDILYLMERFPERPVI